MFFCLGNSIGLPLFLFYEGRPQDHEKALPGPPGPSRYSLLVPCPVRLFTSIILADFEEHRSNARLKCLLSVASDRAWRARQVDGKAYENLGKACA